MVVCTEEVETALTEGTPVVALESTVYSNLGLPSPANAHALEGCVAAIRQHGAVPAVTAVLDGVVRAGLDEHEYERILGEATKTAERDIPVAVAQRWAVGATTVSASLAIAAAVGINVFVTGGIGGVHRGVEETGDVSADLAAIARHRVATISAGIKSFLDLARTLEALEALGVPVVGWETDHLPAFTARRSPHTLPHRFDDLTQLADLVASQQSFGRGLLITNPVPERDALDQQIHDEALAEALAQVAAQGIMGAAVTPFVLEQIARVSEGQSVPANVALVENNAALGARLGAEIARRS